MILLETFRPLTSKCTSQLQKVPSDQNRAAELEISQTLFGLLKLHSLFCPPTV